jgi:sulfur relay protein TusB/DsrH
MGSAILTMALHLLATQTTESVESCRDCLSEADTLVLLGDGVYCLLAPHIFAQLSMKKATIYALSDDVHQRTPGIETSLALITYPDLVNLTLQTNPIVSWY